MTRRWLLTRIAAAPLLWKGFWSSKPLARPLEGSMPAVGGDYRVLPVFQGLNGEAYSYVQAANNFKMGDLVYWNGVPIGFATCDVHRGNYCVIQVASRRVQTDVSEVSQ